MMTPKQHSNPPLAASLRGRGPSATLAINERSAALQAAGRTVYRLGLGQSPFPVPDEVVASLQAHAAEKDYLPVRGLASLRAAVASFHQRVDQIHCSEDDILIGPGSKELLFLAQLAFDGDILLPTPCWVSYRPQAEILGRRISTIPAEYQDRWRLDPERLDAACADGRPRLMILNYPGNPDGLTYGADELQAIAAVARRHGLVVISDEIYGPVHHRGEHISLARFYPEGTIVSGGLSKWCGAGGWRLGTFAVPPALHWLLDAMSTVASETFTSVSAPIQYAAITAYEGSPAIEDYLRRSRQVLSTLASRCTKTVQSAGIRVHAPTGGFYMLLDFQDHQDALAARGIRTSPELCEHLLEDTGVAVLPGTHFGVPAERLTARIAYVDFDGDAALAHAENPAATLTATAKVVEGMEKLAAWITAPS